MFVCKEEQRGKVGEKKVQRGKEELAGRGTGIAFVVATNVASLKLLGKLSAKLLKLLKTLLYKRNLERKGEKEKKNATDTCIQ